MFVQSSDWWIAGPPAPAPPADDIMCSGTSLAAQNGKEFAGRHLMACVRGWLAGGGGCYQSVVIPSPGPTFA